MSQVTRQVASQLPGTRDDPLMRGMPVKREARCCDAGPSDRGAIQRAGLCNEHEATGLHPRCVAVRCINTLCKQLQTSSMRATVAFASW